jgi:hypothetical protein
MKNFNKSKKNKAKEIKQLADSFQEEFQAKLPIATLPDGSAVYKNYLIKETSRKNWGIYHINSRILVNEYYLKTCALMAAKAYDNANMSKFFEIKRLDNRYWASYSDTMVYKNNIKNAKDFDRYLILLNKLEHSAVQADHFKSEISKMFKWSFV